MKKIPCGLSRQDNTIVSPRQRHHLAKTASLSGRDNITVSARQFADSAKVLYPRHFQGISRENQSALGRVSLSSQPANSCSQ